MAAATRLLALLAVCLLCAQSASSQSWEEPYFKDPPPGAGNVEIVKIENIQANIRMDEEASDVALVVLSYKGSEKPSILVSVGDISNLGITVTQPEAGGEWLISVTKPQDYEMSVMRYYNIEVKIAGVTGTVILTVKNINDNRPVFESGSGTCKGVQENKIQDTTCEYKLRDNDGGMNNIKLAVLMADNTVSRLFAVGTKDVKEFEMTVFLRVIQELDYEEVSLYMLTITATVDDTEEDIGRFNLIVEVDDVADMDPVWIRPPLSLVQVDEHSEKSLFSFSARDGDRKIDAKILYSMNVITGDENDFVLDVNDTYGSVSIKPIDRDGQNLDVYVLTLEITAEEEESDANKLTEIVSVIINDINDNIPEITPDFFETTIDEGSTFALSFQSEILIRDPDLADKGQYSVTLEDYLDEEWSSAFIIVPDTGYQETAFTITVADSLKLDYENEKWRDMTFKIVATEINDPSHTSTANVTVHLRDVNDLSPVFDPEDGYTVEVREDIAMGEIVVVLKATDGDANDVIKYRIVTNNRALTVNESTGEVKVARNNAFDFEVMGEQLILQVEASDSPALPQLPHRTVVPLTISIIDVNDVRPSLTLPADQIIVDEHKEAGFEITNSIEALDIDTSAHLEFRIDWARSSATKQGVRVVDTSKFIDCITISTVFQDENEGEAMGILKVGNGAPIDWEVFDTLSLNIVVNDTNTEVENMSEGRASMTILINDINDNDPIFDADSLASAKRVSENADVNTLIGNVFATDLDSNTVLEYSLRPEEGTPDGWIKIESNGQLKTTDIPIDAEDDAIRNTQKLIYTVIASDGERTGEGKITIDVQDVNDNIPDVEHQLDTKTIPENSPSGTPITTLKATDLDITAPFNELYFELNNDFPKLGEYFFINSTTGELKVQLISEQTVLDRDRSENNGNFVIELRVRDNYRPGVTVNSFSVRTNVTLVLSDENDETPEFQTNGPFNVNEELEKDGIVYEGIVAIDLDAPNTPFSELTYRITEVNYISGPQPNPPDDLFGLTQADNKANLIAGIPLRGYYGAYEVTIEAADKGDPPKQSSRAFIVNIQDVNDNPPVFVYPPGPSHQMRLNQTQIIGGPLYLPTGEKLEDIYATDADDGASGNGIVDFNIDRSTAETLEYFTITTSRDNKASLQLQKEFKNFMNVLEMTIVAIDKGLPQPKETSITFKIFVINTDDEAPIFAEEDREVNLKIKENDPLFTDPLKTATDPNNNNRPPDEQEAIYYYLMVGNDTVFKIDKDTGALSLLVELDRESEASYALKVVASNLETKPVRWDVTSEMQVFIEVEDVPDFPPSFAEELYVGVIKPSEAADQEIRTIIADDPDLNDPLRYEILLETMEASESYLEDIMSTAFYLDPVTGVLRTTFVPQGYMKGFFQFKVRATDTVQLTAETTIKVYFISDINRVYFLFANDLKDVDDPSNREFIASVFSNNLGNRCALDLVSPATGGSGEQGENVTSVRTYFVDEEANLPVDAAVIARRASVFETLSTMRRELFERDLNLLDLTTSAVEVEDNLAAVLQTVLIVVSVVLGLLVLILFAAFVLKTRSLNRRLQALSTTKFGSQESGLNRVGMNVPNTNKHAVEGSNPVWNEDVPYDTQSQGSGDSDLIGVEDNPEFGYTKDSDAYGGRGSQEGGYFSSGSQGSRDTSGGYGRNVPSTEL